MPHTLRFSIFGRTLLAGLGLGLGLAGAAAAQPVVTGLAPSGAAAGATVVVSGTGFSATAGRNAVNFGPVRAAVISATPTQLTVRVPAGAASVAPVTVTDLVSRQQGSSLASATPFFTLRFAGPGLNAASYQATRYPVATPQLIGIPTQNIVVADFNADNFPDFALVADGQLNLLLGDGVGGYGPPVQLPAGIRPESTQAADLDADGATDLLVKAASGLLLLHNLGGGNGFASAAPLNLGGRVLAGQPDVQDLDADGLPDLLAYEAAPGGQSNTPVPLLAFRNNGTGFDPPTVLLTSRVLGRAVADFNQDGRLDILLNGPDQFVSLLPYRLVLLARNAANTGYEPPVTSPLNFFAGGALVADFNADGRPDVVLDADNNGVRTPLVLQPTAAGFAVQGPFAPFAPSGGNSLLVADADGDGRPDLWGSAFSQPGGFAVLPGLAGGGLGQPIAYPVAGTGLTAGDFDLDGRTDLASYDLTTGELIVYRYTGRSVSANNPPTLNALPNLTLAEDAPLQTVALTGIGNGGEPGQAVRLTATSDDPALVPAPSVAYFSPTSTGTLRLQPAPDAFGTCLITVTASDGQPQNSTVVRTFRVTVSPVNDAPTLDLIPDVVLTQPVPPSGFQLAVPLSGITAGAANENQLLTVSATVALANGGLVSNFITYASPATTGQFALGVFVNAPGLYGTVTVTVNDGQPLNNISSRTFRVFYNPNGGTSGLPTTAPTLDALPDLTADRALPTQLPVALAGIGDGDPSQVLPLTVTAVSSDPVLVSLGALAYASPAAAGSLPYAISPTRSGTATVRVTVSNGQAQNGSVTRSFRVTVPAAPVVSASRNAAGNAALALYPNPAPDGRFTLAGAAPGPVTLTVLDLSGRVLLTRQLVAGTQPLLLELPGTVRAGVYAVRVGTAGGSVVRRLVVE